MKDFKILILLFLTFLVKDEIYCQTLPDEKVYTSFEDALKAPEKVKILIVDAATVDFILPKSIGDFPNLIELRITCDIMGKFHHTGGSPLKIVPSEIGKLTNLEILDLSWHHISELPKEISNLKKLKYLDLYECSFSKLPAEIGELESLEELDLSINYLKRFPTEIKNCKKMKILKLGLNHFESFPMEIISFKNLEELDLFGVYFKELNIPSELKGLTKLTKLNLASLKLKKFPKVLYDMIQLKELDLSGNSFIEIDDDISKLINLELLILGYNSQMKEKLKSILPEKVKIE